MAKKMTKKAASDSGYAIANGVTTSDWCGHTNYHCPHCPYATTNLGDLEAHVAGRHPDTTAAD